MLPTTAPPAVPVPLASASASASSSAATAASAGPPEAPVPAHEVAAAVGLYIATSITMVMVKYACLVRRARRYSCRRGSWWRRRVGLHSKLVLQDIDSPLTFLWLQGAAAARGRA